MSDTNTPRQECNNCAISDMQNYNSNSDTPIHNFIEIAHDFKAEGNREMAQFYYEFNDQYTDAKHFNDVHFDNQTHQGK